MQSTKFARSVSLVGLWEASGAAAAPFDAFYMSNKHVQRSSAWKQLLLSLLTHLLNIFILMLQ